jgi:hydroxypyruvate reductase
VTPDSDPRPDAGPSDGGVRVHDRDAHARSPAHGLALDCLEAGIAAALPGRAMERELSLDGETLSVAGEPYDLAAFDRLLVLGGGKAAGGLAAALESLLGDRIDAGAVVTDAPTDLDIVECHIGEHPVPGEGSLVGTKRVLELARTADGGTLVLAPVTGGGSALLAAPAGDLSLSDLQGVTEALLDSGAEIEAVNTVRRHCSRVKNGGLARACGDATVVGLLLSDVVGDDPTVVASGPTAPAGTTPTDALSVLERFGVDAPAVFEHLSAGVDSEPSHARNVVLADARTALSAARSVATDRGYGTCLLAAGVRGEAREAALTHVAVAEEAEATGNPIESPAVVLSGGETTVTVEGDGVGGPNEEFCLAAAVALDPNTNTVLACVDTDGRDGSTDAAGALVDGRTVEDPTTARSALADNDAYPYLEERGALLETGRTGTNVNDLRVLVVPGEGNEEGDANGNRTPDAVDGV